MPLVLGDVDPPSLNVILPFTLSKMETPPHRLKLPFSLMPILAGMRYLF
jgi:hypothetical protein